MDRGKGITGDGVTGRADVAPSPSIDVAPMGAPSRPAPSLPQGASDTVRERARRAAASDCTILLVGETGAGKGHFARWLHSASRRSGGPFVPVNCGAIPESLIDSQLFGHQRGAFSGATSDHPGMVRAAERGTLFLDEIADLPVTAQSRLLRLLQEREVQPVGASTPVVVNVRVIAASNADLEEAVADGRFREDLLYRLDVVRLTVEPLRDRPAAIRRLIGTFNDEFARTYRQDPLQFDGDAIRALEQFWWPGNVRQLRTVLERLHVLSADEVITVGHLVDVGQLPSTIETCPDRVSPLDRLRADEVRRILDESAGSVARAAEIIGVHRSTIYRWLRQQRGDAGASSDEG